MVTIDCNDFMKFLTGSEEIELPRSTSERGKTMNAVFRDSCMLVQNSDGQYFIGKLNWANTVGYSMMINEKEKQFSYSDLRRLFKPQSF